MLLIPHLIEKDVAVLLECPRMSLGIYASSRGYIAGSLRWNVSFGFNGGTIENTELTQVVFIKDGGGWIDCSKFPGSGLSIPGFFRRDIQVGDERHATYAHSEL